MLIKEYRIPLPMSLEEYRIAQLYMIQKKSREESEGEGSAVEILENKPYDNGPAEKGQYTYKVYHIGRHLPSWFRSIAPKTALEVHEESWNAYPYTKTRFSVPFVDKFCLEVETIFVQDDGSQENVFKLKPSELRQREIDVIDIVSDSLTGSDYKKDEDPRLYVSTKTERGPLADDWISNPPGGVIMCSYKHVKVEFRYWGLQSKIERFIHDYGLRRVMLRAHRQAWAWQDEWVGLTMDDIRRLERETQIILAQKLGRVPPAELDEGVKEEEEDGEEGDRESPHRPALSQEDGNETQQPSQVMRCDNDSTEQTPQTAVANNSGRASLELPHQHRSSIESSQHRSSIGSAHHRGSVESTHQFAIKSTFVGGGGGGGGGASIDNPFSKARRGGSSRRRKGRDAHNPLRRKQSDASVRAVARGMDAATTGLKQSDSPAHRLSQYADSDDEDSMYSTRPEWALDQIAMESDSGSDLEFFDAKENIEEEEEEEEEEGERESERDQEDSYQEALAEFEDRVAIRSAWQHGSKLTSFDYSGDDEPETPAPHDVDASKSGDELPDILFLILHGGSPMDARDDRVGKAIDFQTISEHMREIIDLHFHSASGRVALRLVPCTNVCSHALNLLCAVNPVPVSSSECGVGLLPYEPAATFSSSVRRGPSMDDLTQRECPCYIPVGAISLLATEHHSYHYALEKVSVSANKVYREFLRSEEGRDFNGQVCLLADCMGSVIAYDILTSSHSPLHPPTPSPPLSTNGSPQEAGRSLLSSQRRRKTSQQHTLSPSAAPTTTSSTAVLTPPPYASPQKRGRGNAVSGDFNSGTHPPYREKDSPSPSFLSLSSTALKKRSSITDSLSSSNASINVVTGVGFVFDVSHFFAFGSPLGLVLASRRAKSRRNCTDPPPRPNCSAFYNLFYGIDQMASRVEPLLDERFDKLLPVSIPPYHRFPTGVDKAHSLKETVVQHPYLFGSQSSSLVPPATNGGGGGGGGGGLTRIKAASMECLVTLNEPALAHSLSVGSKVEEVKPFSVWWSSDRIDYVLEKPKGMDAYVLLPPAAFSHIIHARYWEAKELVSFLLRQVLRHKTVCVKQLSDGKEMIPFVPHDSVVRWTRKNTVRKLQHLSSSHRASDALGMECTLPLLTAKFHYGPLAMASLNKEEVDVYVLTQGGNKPKWSLFGTSATDKHGKLSYQLPEDCLPHGLYPVTFLVKGDHTTASCNLFVVPPHTEAVVFSVDGALSSNFSISASHIRVKQGAVEVARLWQEHGYLIVYITGRPDTQKEKVLSFLGAHGFPLGLVSCADTLSTDSNTNKMLYLARLIKEAKLIIHKAYCSQRHLGVYKELGLQKDQIYVVGKTLSRKAKSHCEYLPDLQNHLAELKLAEPRAAMCDARSLVGDVHFALPGDAKLSDGQRRRKKSSKGPSPNRSRSNSNSSSKRKHNDSIGSHIETTV